ncbi:MAG: hypothetical protein EP340_10970 [Alphaproteobacteria bacterium]|nr:MAG: hypothetical protein EP340_10970 [Alphaproteobacteria bacterium]
MGIFKAGFSMIVSIILGAIVMAFLAIQMPDFYNTLVHYGRYAEEAIFNMGIDQRFVNVMGFLITEQQMVYLFLVILIRILLAVIFAGIGAMFGGRRYSY